MSVFGFAGTQVLQSPTQGPEIVSTRLESVKLCVASTCLFVVVQHVSEFTTDLILL